MAGFLFAAFPVNFAVREPRRPYLARTEQARFTVREGLRYRPRRALVRAAFLAAAERLAEPLVRDAFRAAAERAEALRCEAARRVCFDSEARETVLRGSRLRTPDTARETRGRRFGLRLPWPAS